MKFLNTLFGNIYIWITLWLVIPGIIGTIAELNGNKLVVKLTILWAALVWSYGVFRRWKNK